MPPAESMQHPNCKLMAYFADIRKRIKIENLLEHFKTSFQPFCHATCWKYAKSQL